ncbi:hypothetical protein [Pleionea sediminis]|uniref:hypothetical protein n=1 Tax=Pleionea sediminis TaxID=2569479 RepID=UPI0013DDAE79|nr:hypothetical protein [Pleionea sediminis]
MIESRIDESSLLFWIFFFLVDFVLILGLNGDSFTAPQNGHFVEEELAEKGSSLLH